MRYPRLIITLLTVLSSLSTTTAQAAADGSIVPFTSDLPVCASKCGVLFDVQGKCTPPVVASVDNGCFCSDSRLTPFDNQGTAGVLAVCGAASCTSTSDLRLVKDWFDEYCHTETTDSPASPGSTTSSGSSSGRTSMGVNQSWITSHYKWVIMLVIIFFAIVTGWVGACILRRIYLRKREKEIEMAPPVAWGPHQLQGTSGGYNIGNGITEKTCHTQSGTNMSREIITSVVPVALAVSTGPKANASRGDQVIEN